MSKKLTGEFEEYMKKHNISSLFEDLTESLVTEKPSDIYDFLIKKLGSIQKSKQLKKKVIFVLGGPGCGKGTQCTKLVETGKFLHVCAGELLRKAAKIKDERGKMIANHLVNGTIVPGHVTIGLLREAIKNEKEKTVLIDGFPREMKQGLDFERQVCPATFVLFFTCSEKVLEKRIMQRAKESKVVRSDDNKESLLKRFKTYEKQSMPVIEYFKAKGKLKTISAEETVDEIFEKVKKVMEE